MANYLIENHNLEFSELYDVLHVRDLDGKIVQSYSIPVIDSEQDRCNGNTILKLSASSTHFLLSVETCTFCSQSFGYGFDPATSVVGFTGKTTLGGFALIDLRDLSPVKVNLKFYLQNCPVGLQYVNASLWKLGVCYQEGSNCIQIQS